MPAHWTASQRRRAADVGRWKAGPEKPRTTLAAQSMRDRLDAAEAELDRVRADRDRCLLNANSGYKLANENGRKYGEALSEVARLRVESAELRRQLAFQRDTNHQRNVELDALHHVWCNGGCGSGVHRFTPGEVTEEVVQAAERNTKRLREWWTNKTSRDARAALAESPAKKEGT